MKECKYVKPRLKNDKHFGKIEICVYCFNGSECESRDGHKCKHKGTYFHPAKEVKNG